MGLHVLAPSHGTATFWVSMSGGTAAEREQGTVFGEVAELYDRVRPGYPPALFDEVLAFAPESPRVLEVGAGTGKATIPLAERGLEIAALEPSVAMAAVARRNCSQFPKVPVTVAKFEDWPPERERFQLVVSAQAWHWVDADVRYAKAHEILTRDGALALFWNRPLWDDSALRSPIDDVYARCAPKLKARDPGFPGLKEPAVDEERATEIESSGFFGPVTRRSFRWSKRYTTQDWLALLQTQSDHRMLPASQRADLLGALAEVIDLAGGSIVMNYVTRLYLARRTK
jgi:SAM-dependent methyltransferase